MTIIQAFPGEFSAAARDSIAVDAVGPLPTTPGPHTIHLVEWSKGRPTGRWMVFHAARFVDFGDELMQVHLEHPPASGLEPTTPTLEDLRGWWVASDDDRLARAAFWTRLADAGHLDSSRGGGWVGSDGVAYSAVFDTEWWEIKVAQRGRGRDGR